MLGRQEEMRKKNGTVSQTERKLMQKEKGNKEIRKRKEKETSKELNLQKKKKKRTKEQKKLKLERRVKDTNKDK